MHTVLQDVRYALRTLRRSPAFTLVALVTLALGIGANTAIFSAVNAVLLRPLPYPEPERIVRVFEREGANLGTFSPPNFVDVRAEARSFEALAAYDGTSYALTGEGPAEQLQAATTTAGLFEALATRPVIGRGITAEDAVVGADRVVVLGHALWQRRFGADPGVVGRRIVLDGQGYEVIGVMPAGFAYPRTAELWTPLAFTESDLTTQRGAHYLSAVGRLRPGVTLERADAEVDAIMARLAVEYGNTNEGAGGAVRDLHEYTVGDVRPALLILLGAVGFVLLIACVNVANLLLARAVGREREIAVRTAMGAAPRRLVRQLLTESMVLALTGGAAGLLIAAWSGSLLGALRPEGIPRLDQASVDLSVLGFAFVASLLTGALFGLLPALKAAARIDLSNALKDGGRGALGTRGGWRLRAGMIASEMALAVLLLVGAGLLGKSFLELNDVDPGFDPAGVLTFDILLPDAGYEEPERVAAYYRDLLERIDALPGVESAAAVFGLPMTGFSYIISVEELDGVPRPEDEDVYTRVRIVTPDYFRSMGIATIAGRPLGEQDRYGMPPAIVVNESAAHLLWPGEDPIGHSLEIGTGMGMGRGDLRGEVVGVVRDVKHHGLAQEPVPETYFAHEQYPEEFMSVVVKTAGEPSALVNPIREVVTELDPNVPMFGEQPMAALVAESAGQARFYATLLGTFAVLALALAAVGIYGVMAHVVGQRTRKIGIRIALGAQRAEVVRMVLRQAMAVALAGLAAGLFGAFALSDTLTGLLFELSPTDPLTYVLAGAVLTAAALLASWLPARRAARVDPLEALRHE